MLQSITLKTDISIGDIIIAVTMVIYIINLIFIFRQVQLYKKNEELKNIFNTFEIIFSRRNLYDLLIEIESFNNDQTLDGFINTDSEIKLRKLLDELNKIAILTKEVKFPQSLFNEYIFIIKKINNEFIFDYLNFIAEYYTSEDLNSPYYYLIDKMAKFTNDIKWGKLKKQIQ